MEADPGGQPGTDFEVKHNKLSCMSKYRFVRARISILMSNIISGTWRPLEADPGSQLCTDLEVSHNMPTLHVCLNKGLLESRFKFLCQK